jgi:tetratricopeptide (TPR) repeat protein
LRITAILLVAAHVACAPPPTPVVAPKMTPQELATRLAEADHLASRGCYLCLKEAAGAYSALLALTDDPVVSAHALENNLMLVIREVELRLPDSGALEAAKQLQDRVTSSYANYFAAIDALAGPREPVEFVRGNEMFVPPGRRALRAKLTAELEKEWPASPMKAYYYLAMALNSGMVAELKPQLDSLLSTHSQDLSLKYRTQAFLPLFSMEKARDLIGQETGFGEMHFVIGQRAIMNGYRGTALSDAYRELSRANQLLPDSAAISLVLANVLMAYARQADALAAFERVLKAGPDEAALLGKAKALSYLRRHDEAIAMLDELIKDLRTNPGEKYYWRAWNRLQLGQPQAALDDATAALNAMRNNQVYALAGMAAFGLKRLAEAREYFDNGLQMDRADCDSVRYLGQIDSLERSWKAAAGRYSQAVTCYDDAIVQMRKDLAEYEQDITGLSNALIAAKREQIKDAEALRVSALTNAAVASRNAGMNR